MKNNKNKENLIRFLPYYKKHLLFIIIDLICASLTTTSEIVLPLIVRRLTDIGLNSPEMLTLRVILASTGLYVTLKLGDLLAYYFMCYQGHVVGTKIETDMRSKLFAHLQKLSFSFYTETKIGQIMARITSDLFDITEFSHHCPEEFFIAFIKIAVSFIILIQINVPLTLIMFVSIPIMLFIMAKYNHKLRETFRKQRVALGEINSQVEDSLLGIRVVKSFAKEDLEVKKFEQGNHSLFKTKKASYKQMGSFNTLTRAFDGFMYIVVVGFGAFFMMKKQITPPDLTAYLLYTSMLIASIRRVVEFTEQFQRGMTGIDRYFEILDTPPQIFDSENAVDFDGKNCNILLNNVSFEYFDGQEKVIDNISLEIKQGSHIALVGPSGGGKTTLCNLIPRFYDVTQGEIVIGDKNIKDYTLKSLRRNIGVVMQDVYLFSGTVKDNIAYGKENATMEEIIESAKKAGCHEFIMSLKNGYDTYVGERGVKLSGGQKQRISIARVFLKDPPILILDEATSALDNQSEFLVQESLEKLAKNRTTITVAHRLSTIENSDEIIVLDDNKIVERGTHKTLLEQKGLYYNLYVGYKKLETI